MPETVDEWYGFELEMLDSAYRGMNTQDQEELDRIVNDYLKQEVEHD